MKPSLDIVIVNWNSGGQLRACVESIAEANREGIDLQRVVVVDNASHDGSSEGLSFPQLPLVVERNLENRGFAAACNQGARASAAQYLLFLNPDARTYADTLSRAVGFMEKRRTAGICGVALEDERGNVHRSCCRIPRTRALLTKALGLDRVHRVFQSYAMTEWSHDDTRQVGHVIGAFYLVRDELFRELNGFDERFFVYLEDLDFSVRAQAAGWECWFVSETRAFHRGGGTSEQIKAARLFYSLRSRLLYAAKHLTTAGRVGVSAATLVVEPFARVGGALIRRAWSQMPETVEAYARLWKWFVAERPPRREG